MPRGESWRSAAPVGVAGFASWQAAWIALWQSNVSRSSPAPAGGGPIRPRRRSSWWAKPPVAVAPLPRWAHCRHHQPAGRQGHLLDQRRPGPRFDRAGMAREGHRAQRQLVDGLDGVAGRTLGARGKPPALGNAAHPPLADAPGA